MMWPVTYIGSFKVLKFLRVFCLISLAGPYGLYEGVMIAMLLAFIVWSSTSGLTERDYTSTDGIIWFSTYAGVAILSGVIQIFFMPSINEWFIEVRQAEAAEEDTLDQLGFFEDEDSGPIIFADSVWDDSFEF